MGEQGRPATVPGPGSPGNRSLPGVSFLGIVQLVFRIFFVSQLFCPHGAFSCRESEYETQDGCCPRCEAGYRVSKHCTNVSSTSCIPCTKGTYTAHANGLLECLNCHICDPELHLRAEKECTHTRNTVCSCDTGYFCEHLMDGACEQCVKHAVAPPGFRVTRNGTNMSDVLYEACPFGTFSATEMSFSCEHWTNCAKVGMKEVQGGTATSDAVCVCRCHDQVQTAVLTSVFTVLLILLLAASVGFIIWRRRRSLKKGAIGEPQVEANGDYLPVQEDDKQMMAPMQETAPHHGEPAYSIA